LPGRGERCEQLVPSRVLGLAGPRDPVDVLERDPASWAHDADHFSHQGLRSGRVVEHEALVREVKRFRGKSARESIGLKQRHVAKLALGDRTLRECERPRLVVKPHHVARASDPFAEQIEHAQGAAANVDRASADVDRDMIEQRLGCRAMNLGLGDQTRKLAVVSAKDVLPACPLWP
jgi:hypothetical protein